MAVFFAPVFAASQVLRVSDLHLKFTLRPGHTMCASMADIHSAMAEIRRGKREESRRSRRNHRIKI